MSRSSIYLYFNKKKKKKLPRFHLARLYMESLLQENNKLLDVSKVSLTSLPGKRLDAIYNGKRNGRRIRHQDYNERHEIDAEKSADPGLMLLPQENT